MHRTLTTTSVPTYVDHRYAQVPNIIAGLQRGSSPVFIGPKSCGKSTMLRQVYCEMKASDTDVAFIDMHAIGEENERALNALRRQTLGNVDITQALAETHDKLCRTVKKKVKQGKGACYAFSPDVGDPKGSSVLSIPSREIYYFTPFTDEE